MEVLLVLTVARPKLERRLSVRTDVLDDEEVLVSFDLNSMSFAVLDRTGATGAGVEYRSVVEQLLALLEDIALL
jgi:hypothetical protein